MLHVAMPGFAQKVTEPLVFAPDFLFELETLLRAVKILCPEHAEYSLGAGKLVRVKRIIEDGCVFDGPELPEITGVSKVHATPAARFTLTFGAGWS